MQQNQKPRERSYSHQSSARKVQQTANVAQQQQQQQQSQKPSTITPIPTNNLQPFQANIERPSSNRNEPMSRSIGQYQQQQVLKGSQLFATQTQQPQQQQPQQQQESYTQKIKESPYYSSIGQSQRPSTTDRMRNQIMNLQQVYSVKPQTAQNSFRLEKAQQQQDDSLRYSTPLQKKGSSNTAMHSTATHQQGTQSLQSSSNNFYQLGKSVGSQQGTAYIAKGKQNQNIISSSNNPNETKLPQFSTPQPIKDVSKSQQSQQSFMQTTQYQSAQYSIQQTKPKHPPHQVMQNYLGTSEKEKQGASSSYGGSSQLKMKKGSEVSKKIDFSNESNIDNFMRAQGKGEGGDVCSSSSQESLSKQESPNYARGSERFSNDQLKANTKSTLQSQSQQQSSKQQKHSVQSNLRGDSNIISSKQQGDITNSQYSRPKSPSEIYSSHKSKAHSSQPKKLSETSDNFYKSSKSPYEKQSSQTLKNFYISKTKPPEKLAGSRKRIYSTTTHQSEDRSGLNTSYPQKPQTAYQRNLQDPYQNIDISLNNPADGSRKQKLSQSNSGEMQEQQSEREERKEDFHSSIVDYNFDLLQFQNIQRPPCRKKLNTFNVEGIGASKGPVKPRHDIQVSGDNSQNPLRPPSRHKLPPKNIGLGFSDSEESGEDIPVREMFQNNQEERNELVFSHDTSLLRPKKLSEQSIFDQFNLPKNQEESISKTFNINSERPLQSRETQQTRPKSSRTNRSKSHISKQGTETQIPGDSLFDDDLADEKLKEKKFSLNNYANIPDYNTEDQLSNSSDERERISPDQSSNPKTFSIATKRLQGSDIVIKHNVGNKKPLLDKIQLPFETKLGVEFIGLFANYQEGDKLSHMQTPQNEQLRPYTNEQRYRQQQLLQQQQLQQQLLSKQGDVFSTPSPHSVQQQGYQSEEEEEEEQKINKDNNNNQIDDFEEEQQKFNRY